MISSLLLCLLWISVWICHLNSLPPYRRQNPFHLPSAGPFHHGFCRLAPLLGLMGSLWVSGVEGVFLWAFTGPLTGVLTGLVVPLLAPAQKEKEGNNPLNLSSNSPS